MKICHVTLLALFFSLSRLAAQVSVEVTLEQDKFLPGEAVATSVRIVNRSGETLHLGEGNEWVKFTIENDAGIAMPQLTEPPVQNPVDLESAERATLQVDVAPHFDLRGRGRYRISATVKIKEWNAEVMAKPVDFEIVEGTKLWEQEFGVPRSGTNAQPPELRRYTLQEANYLQKQLRLYLRVSTANGHVLKLLNLGPMISFSHPMPQLDKRSRLHVLYQDGAKSFKYVAVNPDGEIEVRQAHEYSESRPRLRLDENGEIKVLGGERRLTLADLPVVVITTTNAAPTNVEPPSPTKP